jgi:hypothetical protein
MGFLRNAETTTEIVAPMNMGCKAGLRGYSCAPRRRGAGVM